MEVPLGFRFGRSLAKSLAGKVVSRECFAGDPKEGAINC